MQSEGKMFEVDWEPLFPLGAFECVQVRHFEQAAEALRDNPELAVSFGRLHPQLSALIRVGADALKAESEALDDVRKSRREIAEHKATIARMGRLVGSLCGDRPLLEPDESTGEVNWGGPAQDNRPLEDRCRRLEDRISQLNEQLAREASARKAHEARARCYWQEAENARSESVYRRKIMERDAELCMEQAREISALKSKVNQLQQQLKSARGEKQ